MKKKTGTILASVGIGLAVLLSAGAIVKVTNNEKTKNVAGSAFSWEVGALSDETGKKVTSTSSLRTKDYITVDGFEIDVDDETENSFVLFLYDEDKTFLSCTTELDEDYVFADDYAGADKSQVEYVKVVLNIDDEDISTLEIPGYVSPITITVNK